MALSHNLGFPRIGNRRHLKFALESYWKGQSDAGELDTIARQIRKAARQYQQGLDLQPVGDFSFYDHVLDTSVLLGVIPARFGQDDKEPVSLDTYFRVARGRAPTGEDTFASEMTKWFDTNYHYLVPEITADQAFRLASTKLFDEVQEAREQGITVKPVLLGPVTWLYLAKVKGEEFDRLTLLPRLLDAYRQILATLAAQGVEWLQIDEPAFRELMPLRKAPQAAYLAWAEKAFRLSASVVADTTQIHTHMCYSEFNEIIESIARLDADVITIETSRSDMELLDVFRDFAYPNEIGPGVYDIHSPRIPSVPEMVKLIEKAVERLPKERIWVNPDCGLKTRNWEETRAALANMVVATLELRAAYAEAQV